MVTYYDLVLALIPLTLLGVSGVLSGVGLSMTVAVPVGGALAAGLVGHAMFVNGPTASGPGATGRGSTLAAD